MKALKKWFSRHSIIWVWLISYSAILIIPIICNVIIYSSSLYSLKKTTLNKEYEVLEAAVFSVEDMFFSLNATADLIEKASNTNSLMDEESDSVAQKRLVNASKFLSSHKISNEHISSIYIYYPHLDQCVSDNSVLNSSAFFNKLYDSQLLSYNDWYNKLNSFNYGDYIITKDENDKTIIDFFYSIPLYSLKEEKKASVVIRVSKEKLLSIIEKNFSFASKNFYIINKDNEVIIKHETIDNISLPLNSENIKNSILSFPDCNITAYSSSSIGWEFFSAIPDITIEMEQKQMRMLLLSNFIFLLIASSVIVAVITSKNYAPIRKIKTLINSSFGSTDKNINEYEQITELISSYTKTTEDIKKRQKLTEKNLLLCELIKADSKTDNALFALKNKYHIDFISELFVVTSFKVMNVDKLFSDEDTVLDFSRKNEYVEFIISNIFEELMQHYGHMAVTFTYHNSVISIISIDKDKSDDWKNDILEVIHTTKEHIYKNFNLLITVNSSDLHNGISYLPEAYFEAVYNQSDLEGISFYTEDESDDYIGNISKTKLMYLSNFIKSGAKNSAKQIAEKIYLEYINTSKQEFNHKIFLFILSCTIFDAAFQTSDKQSLNDYTPLYNSINKLNNLEHNQKKNKQFLFETIDLACTISQRNIELLRKKEEEERITCNSTDFIDNVKQFIDEHYTDVSMNVAFIGIHFKISSYYVSNQFKKYEGISLPDYISKKRIEKAKKLILDSDKPLSEIAIEVGFGSVRTFTRAFQKSEDVLPVEFRKMNTK